jgi:uncharacterized protein
MKSRLIQAVLRESLSEVQAALRSGTAVDERDADGRTALFHAAIDGLDPIVQVLLSASADVRATDKLGMTPLHYAVQEKHGRTAQLLVGAGASPSAADANGNTPVHRAVFAFDGTESSASILKLLLMSGADLRARNSAGVSAEDLARTRGLDLESIRRSQ